MNDDAEAALWLWAISVFGFGDYVTTKAGLEMGAVEKHPVSDAAMDLLGPDASMAAGKAVVIAAAIGGYYLAHRQPETRHLAPIFPTVLLLIGLGIVSHNVRTLENL